MRLHPRWSPVVAGLEPLSSEMWVPTRSIWRRSVGFNEDHRGGAAPNGLEPCFRVSHWLRQMPTDIRLRLAFKVGGAQRSVAWLGVVVAGSSATSLARLEHAAADLAEALDIWHLYTDVPGGGPRSRERSLGLRAVGPLRDLDDPDEPPRTLRALRDLARLDVPRTLVFDQRPGSTTPELMNEIRTAHPQASRLQVRRDAPIFSPQVAQVSRVQLEAQALWQCASAPAIRVQLHGQPPRAILLDVLEDALSEDLGQAVRFADALPHALCGRPGPAASMLRTLSTGVKIGTDYASIKPTDDIPF